VSAGLGPGATIRRCDVADARAVDLLIETVRQRFGRLDILVANAGIGGGGARR
jgi:NAD(P)-dependent dehydrogenase (short-subunit alcohol dehydrogenase family)